MADFDWKAVIRNTAPVLGAALGGPLAGAAIKVLGDQLLGNADATESDVAAAVVAGLTGEQIAAMKQAELNFQLEMRRISQAEDAAAYADTADARAQTVSLAQSGSSIAWGAPVISTIVTVGFFLCIFMVFFRGDDLPDNLTSLVNYLFGALTSGFIGTTQYWLGSSAGSKRAGDAVREIAVNSSKAGRRPGSSN